LLRLGIDAGSRFPLLLHELAEAGQDEFAVLLNRFVSEARKRIQENCDGSLIRLGHGGESDLRFGFGHSSHAL